jgi:hypothetical protein
MNKGDFQDYLALLESLGKTLEDLTSVEQEKTAFVRDDDLDGLNACMKREQALSLALRSYEQKRFQLLQKMGLSGVSLAGLAAHAPEELRLETKRISQQFRLQYEMYRAASQVARDTLECNLHQVEKVLRSENPGFVFQDGGQSESVPWAGTDFRA